MALEERASVCTFDCPDTCSLTVTVEDDRLVKVRGSDALPYTAIQTPDGLHLRDGRITGNREFRLVSGQAFPGCV